MIKLGAWVKGPLWWSILNSLRKHSTNLYMSKSYTRVIFKVNVFSLAASTSRNDITRSWHPRILSSCWDTTLDFCCLLELYSYNHGSGSSNLCNKEEPICIPLVHWAAISIATYLAKSMMPAKDSLHPYHAELCPTFCYHAVNIANTWILNNVTLFLASALGSIFMPNFGKLSSMLPLLQPGEHKSGVEPHEGCH